MKKNLHISASSKDDVNEISSQFFILRQAVIASAQRISHEEKLALGSEKVRDIDSASNSIFLPSRTEPRV